MPAIAVPAGVLNKVDDLTLVYDEYVVFEPTQIRNKYLVKVQIV